MQGVNRDHDPGFSPQPTPPRKGWSRPQNTAQKPRRDPAPSRLAYRLNRMWLTPGFRKLTRVGLPAFLIAFTALLWLSDEDRRASLAGGLTGMVEKVQNREQFMVKVMTIDGASEPVDKALRMMLPVDLPTSSFDIDLDQLRQDILMLDAVKDVELRVKPGGVLAAEVSERRPVMLWRHARGIEQLDEEGHRVASVTERSVRSELPLIAGEGADKAAAEAMRLFAAAGPLLPRVRGLQRVGERRWDVVLDRGQRIRLPAEGAVAALERVIALNGADDLLGRDVSVVDLRNGKRPTAQIGVKARNTIRAARGQPLLGPNGEEPEEDTKS
ncbi:cell division protein FtsQ/DivIB [Paracoccus aerodenitrificans]|uniref:cell division protein FtsQ/DivIB n=1 Tax=Paracoccus aerodenitrificans TaxID=3017781 RepID=UPI0022F05ACB|nr:cell division protein FtsQ/DivIB [Paracoccus aerodenitrificans]WBU63384.1 cell division protein FtsQ/DivIB [Paracoccus aerodenitrificans]